MSSNQTKNKAVQSLIEISLQFFYYLIEIIVSINLQSTNRSVNKVSEEVEFILFDRLCWIDAMHILFYQRAGE